MRRVAARPNLAVMTVRRLSRRTFLSDLGKGTIAVAIFGPLAVACSSSGEDEGPPDTEPTSATQDATSPTSAADATTSSSPPSPEEGGTAQATSWSRVNLGFVSAYLVVRGSRAAVVDTGVEGSAGDIEASLNAMGLGWDAVDDVVLTHLHGDHIGSLRAVMTAAGAAEAHAGEADISAMDSPRPISAVGDGDEVFGLQIIETPGHTAGHISVLDPIAGVLVAGDALNGTDGGVTGANPQFTADMAMADESVKKLAALRYETAFFGHGDPVETGAAGLVTALAAGL